MTTLYVLFAFEFFELAEMKRFNVMKTDNKFDFGTMQRVECYLNTTIIKKKKIPAI